MSLNNLDAIKLRMTLDDTHVDIADEWISEVVSLQQHLADERVKVAELESTVAQNQATIRGLVQDKEVYIGFWHQEQREHNRLGNLVTEERAKVAELEKEISAFKPFDICEWRKAVRREVAREIADWLDLDTKYGSEARADAIRAKFGVKS